MIIVRHHETCSGRPSLDGRLTGTCDCKVAPMDAAARAAVTVLVDALGQESRAAEEDREYLALRLDMLAELIADQAAEARCAEPLARSPAPMDDLPPDALTGLYLDRPFDVDDLEWIRMAWGAYLSRRDEGPRRPFQLMLVFQAIRHDELAARAFLRVMNMVILPLCRRRRLQEQPHLRDLGAANK
jgi:hypothetical protein